MTRTKRAARRGLTRKQEDNSPAESEGTSTPAQHLGVGLSSNIVPDRVKQIQQVDNWRSYREDTSNLQTATNFPSVNQHQPTFGQGLQRPQAPAPRGPTVNAWESQSPPAQQLYSPPPLGQQAYPPGLQNPTALTFRPPIPDEHSHYKPYQPLRMSNGNHETQMIQQATNALQSQTQIRPRAQPQAHGQSETRRPNELRQSRLPFAQDPPATNGHRYQLRRRTDEHIAPFSTGAAPRTAQSKKAACDPSALNVPTAQRATPRPKWSGDVPGPAAPNPTKQYKRYAESEPATRETPQKLLVVLDLNGTLLVRPNKHKPTNIIVRPGVPALLDYLFQNHVVMVYTSSKPHNSAAMIEKFFRPDQRAALAAVWARDKLGLTQVQYNSKVQVYKQLEPIWQDHDIQRTAEPGRQWDHSNTVLVDDSQAKALAQPHNLLQIPEFLNNRPTTSIQGALDWHRAEKAIVFSVEQKLEQLKSQVSVSRLIRQWQNGMRQAPGVVDETVDQKALQNAEDRRPSPSPTPSIGERESSHEPQQLQASGDSTMSIVEDLPQYEPVETRIENDGVSTDEEGGVSVDDLEKHINRNLSLNQESPD